MHLPRYTNAGAHREHAISEMQDVAYAADNLPLENTVKYYQTAQTDISV